MASAPPVSPAKAVLDRLLRETPFQGKKISKKTSSLLKAFHKEMTYFAQEVVTREQELQDRLSSASRRSAEFSFLQDRSFTPAADSSRLADRIPSSPQPPSDPLLPFTGSPAEKERPLTQSYHRPDVITPPWALSPAVAPLPSSPPSPRYTATTQNQFWTKESLEQAEKVVCLHSKILPQFQELKRDYSIFMTNYARTHDERVKKTILFIQTLLISCEADSWAALRQAHLTEQDIDRFTETTKNSVSRYAVMEPLTQRIQWMNTHLHR